MRIFFEHSSGDKESQLGMFVIAYKTTLPNGLKYVINSVIKSIAFAISSSPYFSEVQPMVLSYEVNSPTESCVLTFHYEPKGDVPGVGEAVTKFFTALYKIYPKDIRYPEENPTKCASMLEKQYADTGHAIDEYRKSVPVPVHEESDSPPTMRI